MNSVANCIIHSVNPFDVVSSSILEYCLIELTGDTVITRLHGSVLDIPIYDSWEDEIDRDMGALD